MEPVKDWFERWQACLAVTLLVMLVVCWSPAWAAEYDFAWPVKGAASGEVSAMAKSEVPPYMKRQGRIGIAVNLIVAAQALKPGDSLTLNFFEDSPYTVIVRTIKHDTNGIVTITGNIAGEDLSTFILTGSPESYLITLQDLSKSIVYRVSGDMLQGEGAVSEVDQKKMPPMIHLPPLTPKK